MRYLREQAIGYYGNYNTTLHWYLTSGSKRTGPIIIHRVVQWRRAIEALEARAPQTVLRLWLIRRVRGKKATVFSA